MRCIHRVYVWACGPCRRSATNLRSQVPPPCSEQERVARRLLAQQVEARRLDDEGEGYVAGGLCICVRVTDDGITDMTGCPVHGRDAA